MFLHNCRKTTMSLVELQNATDVADVLYVLMADICITVEIYVLKYWKVEVKDNP